MLSKIDQLIYDLMDYQGGGAGWVDADDFDSKEMLKLKEIVAVDEDKKLGSSWIPGSYSKNPFNEAFQERFAPFSHVVNEFKKAQIERKFFLRDPSMGSQPGT